jgi:hypothetical protein
VFECLTEPARRVIVLAQEQSRELSHDYVGSEHLLLGVLAVRDCLGARALISMGVTFELVRERVIQKVGVGDRDSPEAIPFTPRAKRLLTVALEEALSHHDQHIGTEHLLLAVLGEDEAVAAGVLRDLGLDLQHARVTVEQMPGTEAPPSADQHSSLTHNIEADGPTAGEGATVTVGEADSQAYDSAAELARAFGSFVLEPTWWPADTAGISYVLVRSSRGAHYRIESTRTEGVPICVVGHLQATLSGRTPRDWLHGEWSEPPKLAHVRGLIGKVGIPRRLQAAIYDQGQQLQLIGYDSEAEILKVIDSLHAVSPKSR